jgi:hypothetical protein
LTSAATYVTSWRRRCSSKAAFCHITTMAESPQIM